MNRVRVSELAKELGLETKAVLAQFGKLGIQVKNHLSMVTEGEATKLKSALHPGKNITDKDSSQKSGSKIFIRRKVLDVSPASTVSSVSHETNDVSEKETEVKPTHVTSASVESTPVESLDTLQNIESKTEQPTPQPAVNTQASVESLTQKNLENTELTASAPTSIQETKTTLLADTAEAVKSSVESPVETTKATTPPASVLSQPNVPQKEAVIAPKPVPSSTPARATSSFTGATIIRRAPENVYQVNMTKPARPESTYQPYGQRRPSGDNRFAPRAPSSDGRFAPRPSSDGRFPPRPSSSDGRFPPRPSMGNSSVGGAHSQTQQKSFVMADTIAPNALKDSPSRFKDYNKEREKRRVQEDNERNNKSRVKGARFYEQNEFDETRFTDDTEGSVVAENTINVRTMVSSKKRKPVGFKRKDAQHESNLSNPTKASKKVIRIDEHISVNDLAVELSQKAGVVIKTLMKLGMFATANKVLDFDTATLVAHEFAFETQNVNVTLEDIIAQKHDKQQVSLVVAPRPPIITIMGHVDHGKTSLLDALRQTNVVASEAGGITQHIGAYQIEYQNRKLTFLDTPGHEAFTAMRARGAKVTDIVVLVVAADDGVMPQTIEAVAHAKAANVPLIVAINKIDKPNINIDRITRELSEQGVMSEEWGGDSIFVQVSAKTRKGLDQLIEAILLQADVLDLKAPTTGFAEGVVIEAKRDKARGPVATVIVTKGLLKQQDSIVVGKTMGRVRAMYGDNSAALKEALPGMPVELIGLDNVPDAGDTFHAVASDAIAREAVAYRVEKHRQAVLASQKPASMNDLMVLFEQKETSQKANELHIILKADTHGSAEAIKASLQKLDTTKVKAKVVLAAVGGITETDIVLADASNALVLGFNVRPDKIAQQRAESTGIKMMYFNIIYELIDAVKVAMAGTLAPIKQDKIIGHAEVRNLFTVPKVGVIAGSLVTDGKIVRPCRLRIVRDSVVLYTGQLGSLKRFKEDAKEVAHGFECGIGVENYNDLKIGDVLEAFVVEEIAAQL